MMISQRLSQGIAQVTQPQHPLYFPVQFFLFSSASYIGTACLTSLSPIHGMAFVSAALVISRVVAPLLSKELEPYRQIALVPLLGQVAHLTASFLLAKAACALTGYHLTLRQACHVSIASLISIYILKFALLKFRIHFQPSFPIDRV